MNISVSREARAYVSLKTLAIALVLGILVSYALGFVENRYGVGIPESKHYGYPLVWQSVQFLQQPQITEYNFNNFTLNAAFWIMVSLAALLILRKLQPKTSSFNKDARAHKP